MYYLLLHVLLHCIFESFQTESGRMCLSVKTVVVTADSRRPVAYHNCCGGTLTSCALHLLLRKREP